MSININGRNFYCFGRGDSRTSIALTIVLFSSVLRCAFEICNSGWLYRRDLHRRADPIECSPDGRSPAAMLGHSPTWIPQSNGDVLIRMHAGASYQILTFNPFRWTNVKYNHELMSIVVGYDDITSSNYSEEITRPRRPTIHFRRNSTLANFTARTQGIAVRAERRDCMLARNPSAPDTSPMDSTALLVLSLCEENGQLARARSSRRGQTKRLCQADAHTARVRHTTLEGPKNRSRFEASANANG
ncbi:hypothetical protein PSPO01_14664 [Paraphaeosphaeria sporulosa]